MLIMEENKYRNYIRVKYVDDRYWERIEDFEVNSFEIESAEFVVTKPKREVYNVNAYEVDYG